MRFPFFLNELLQQSPTDLDFNATTLSLELNAELETIITTITVPVYNDGVEENEEGFVLLLGVSENQLDSRDVGYVNVLSPVVLVRLMEGGIEIVKYE